MTSFVECFSSRPSFFYIECLALVSLYAILKHSHYGRGQRTLAPEVILMSFPEMTCPFTNPGLSLIFRRGASKVPSTIALQQPTPPPPPEKATSEPAPMML